MLPQTSSLPSTPFVAERRSEPRDQPSRPSRGSLETMILGTYREMPGLSLSAVQAARLFGVSARTAEVVLDELGQRGLLYVLRDGRYMSARNR